MNFRLPLLILSALALTISAAKAQFSNGEVTGDSSILAVGTVLYAYNFDGGANSANINGVTFVGINPYVTSQTNFTLSNSGGIDGTGAGNMPDGTDGNYSTGMQVLNENGIGGNLTLVLNGLTAGRSYSFEAVFDSNQKDARTQSLVDSTNGANSGTVTTGGDQGYPVQNPNPHPTGAEYIIENFVATGTSETFVAQSGGGAGSQLSGFVVEVVPEPGTWALMSLGALSLAFVARRKALQA